jgi:energy-coupling factor transporter ATP-binding protein EcfA2
MKIKSLQLKNFKRFTDLTLQDIPENAKLVLLIGSNGSGKSSVFDAFEVLDRFTHRDFVDNKDLYYSKAATPFQIIATFYDEPPVNTNEINLRNSHKVPTKSFYGRTSFRQIPNLTRRSLGQPFDISTDTDRPKRYIERDERFENDLEHLLGRFLREIFSPTDTGYIIKSVVDPINKAFVRIFGSDIASTLQLTQLIPPLEGNIAQIVFKKGDSAFLYDQLSAGEKEIFNILINLIARKDYYKNSIYFFDEIDLHLNTKLQFNLLKEIVEQWIPEGCQFWTASHSLGFIEYAKQTGESVTFDFDDLNFDYPKILNPIPKDNPDVYEIAVGKDILPKLFKNFQVYFVENRDEKYYAQLDIEKTMFPGAANKYSVFQNVVTTEHNGIIDRDFLSDEDIELIEKEYPKLFVLRFYCIENYLYHPGNLAEYFKNNTEFSREQYILQLSEEKKKVTNEIVSHISMTRLDYPFFKEQKFETKGYRKRFRSTQENSKETQKIISYLQSDVPDEFLKVMSLKDYGKQIPYRQNISPTDLAKTEWFKKQISLIKRKKLLLHNKNPGSFNLTVNSIHT